MFTLIVISTIVFIGIISALIAVLTLVESKLVSHDDCQIVINGDKQNPVKVAAGTNLLAALAAQKIFIPSACGGSGTCAMCKCKVTEGGGDVLPTETGQLTRGEQKDQVRLSCQVKVKNDLEIEIPEEIFSIKKFECTVTSNSNVATFIKELQLQLPEGESMDFQAGGYIQIDIPEYKALSYKNFEIEEEYRSDWDKFKLWEFTANNEEDVFRAYSMANHPAEGNRVTLNVRIASPPPNNPTAPPGIASSYIFNLKPGDKAMVSGPYGEFFIKDIKKK